MHGWNSCARLIGKSEEKLSPSEQRTIFVESSPISEHSLRPGIYGYIWVHMDICGYIWIYRGIYGYIKLMHGYIWVYIGMIGPLKLIFG